MSQHTLGATECRWAGSLVLLAVGLISAGCSQAEGDAANKKEDKGVPDVLYVKAVRKTVTDYEIFTGRTDAKESVNLKARVTGYLISNNFKEGDIVQAGTVLFEIDPNTYEAELSRADANLNQSKVHFDRLKKDFQRSVKLLANKATSQEEHDKIDGDYAEAEAAVRVAHDSKKMAKINYDYTKIIAPITGRIGRRMVDPGNLVKADETVLAAIVSLDPMYVYFDVDERTLLKLRRLAQKGKIGSQDGAGADQLKVRLGLADSQKDAASDDVGKDTADMEYPLAGVVNFVDNRVDSLTGTLRKRASFVNKDGLLTPGMFARIKMPVGVAHPAILIPEKALSTDQGRKFVFVIQEKKDKDGNVHEEVEYRQVVIGSQHGRWRVIANDEMAEKDRIAENDRIVVTGLQRLRPGVRVDAPRVSQEFSSK